MQNERRHFRLSFCILHFALCISLAGCGGPSQANNELRRKNDQLQTKLRELQDKSDLEERTIQRLQNEHGSLPTLPEDRLEKLFVAKSLKFGRLTGGDDLNQPGPGDHGLEVEIVPVDAQGDAIKAAGTIQVQLFDLSLGKDALIGDWHFDLKQSRDSWLSGGLLDSYVLKCPWQKIPTHSQLTVRVTFFDELTQTTLPPAEKVVKVNPPPN